MEIHSSDSSQPNAFTKYVQSSRSASLRSTHNDLKSPPPAPPHQTSSENIKRSSGSSSGGHFDLAAAQKEFESCHSLEEKAELRGRLKEGILKRLQELTETGGTSKVAIEIADIVDFVKVLYPSNHNILKSIVDISEKSREAVIKFQEGLKLLEKAQDLLRKDLQPRHSSELD